MPGGQLLSRRSAKYLHDVLEVLTAMVLMNLDGMQRLTNGKARDIFVRFQALLDPMNDLNCHERVRQIIDRLANSHENRHVASTREDRAVVTKTDWRHGSQKRQGPLRMIGIVVPIRHQPSRSVAVEDGANLARATNAGFDVVPVWKIKRTGTRGVDVHG